MAADGTNTGSRSSDVPAQKQEIDQHLDRFHSGPVLCQAHPVNRNHAFGARINRGRRFDSVAAQARLALKSGPTNNFERARRNPSKPWTCSLINL